jgi:hypothetical protein
MSVLCLGVRRIYSLVGWRAPNAHTMVLKGGSNLGTTSHWCTLFARGDDTWWCRLYLRRSESKRPVGPRAFLRLLPWVLPVVYEFLNVLVHLWFVGQPSLKKFIMTRHKWLCRSVDQLPRFVKLFSVATCALYRSQFFKVTVVFEASKPT